MVRPDDDLRLLLPFVMPYAAALARALEDEVEALEDAVSA
jgi:hypothetical protein